MKRLMLVLLSGLWAAAIAAEIDLTKTVPAITLRDGRVLRQVVILGFSGSSFMAKWDGGRGTVAYSNLPDDIRGTFESRRPTPPPPVPDQTGMVIHTPEGTRTVPVGTRPESLVAQTPIPEVRPPKLTLPDEQALLASTVSGQVFVTTKGGNNIKLGGVTVGIYPQITIEEFRHWWRPEIKRLRAHFSTMMERYRGVGAHDKVMEMAAAHDETRYILMGHLPAATAWATTDADGRYKIEHRVPKPFVVVARARREVADDSERYIWLVSSTSIPPSGELLLHNENME